MQLLPMVRIHLTLFNKHISEETELQQVVATLEELISSHDVIFLALDSREARWLPSVIGAKYSKVCCF